MGQNKTKAQLLAELDTAHATIAALEEELRQGNGGAVPGRKPAARALPQAGGGGELDDDSFRRLVEGAAQGIFVMQNYKAVYANKAYAELFGYQSVDEMIGRDHMEFVAPVDKPRLQALRDARRRGEFVPERYVHQGIRKDGSLVWVDGFRQWITWRGRPAIQATVIDITAQKLAEETLRENEAQLQQVFDSVPHTMALKDKDSRYLLVNKAWSEFYGVEPENAVGKSALEILGSGQDEQARITETDRTALLGDEPVQSFRQLLMGPRGDQRSFQTVKSPIRDSSGAVTGLVVISLDITEQRQAEEELAANQRLLQTIFDSIPIGMFVKDRERRYLMINRAHAERNNLDREAIKGLLAADVPQWSEVEIKLTTA